MDAKYYTPKIEEFHVGFEYEQGDDQFGWKGEQVTLGGDFDYYDDLIREGRIRVKHLDRQDIEECGWTYSNLAQRFFHSQTGLPGDERNAGKGIWFYQIAEGNYILIDCRLPTHRVRFEGQINNKSELRKIMKMLKID